MRQTRPDTVDDYLALARQLFRKRGNEKQIIELMRDSIALKPTDLAYFYRAKAMRLAMEKLPQGAAVIDKRCEDIPMGPDNDKHRCVVDYTTDAVQ